jgi:hypothetical protein
LRTPHRLQASCEHDWLISATCLLFTSGADSHPFYGAPALAHVLACAAEHLPAACTGSDGRNLDLLDRQLAGDVRQRVDAAHRRIDAGRAASGSVWASRARW